MFKRIVLCLSALLRAACSNDVPQASSRPPAGNPSGSVIVQVYSDIQCPACKSAHAGVVKPILQKYGEVVRLEYKHFPLRALHRFAMDGAESSECAADQGKFWEYIDIAFENQDEISYDSLVRWAEEIGLDGGILEKCWKSHSKRKIVLADYEEGRKLGVDSTPTFFVNGKIVKAGFDTVSEAIEGELKVFEQRL